jgi:2-keto-4-pentenoate hydratase/2-oxohepta-3-ene-1,7-dioic acid hydratase in catechol pathway
VKLVRFDRGRTGLLVSRDGMDAIVDIAPALGEGVADSRGSWVPLIARWDDHRGALEELAADPDATALPLASTTLEPPLPATDARIFALGGNFPAHVAGAVSAFEVAESVKSGREPGKPPWGFAVLPGTIVGSDADIHPPRHAQKLDYEGEVAVVFGGDVAGAGDAPIWGYTAWNDFSIRDAALGLSMEDHGPLSWAMTKNFHTGHACGPCMVVGNGADVNHLRILCRVNGVVRQDDTTASMTFSFAEVAAHLSTFLPLGAGDMVLSGSPAGTAVEQGLDGPFLREGDAVEVEVDGVGVLRNRVGAAR